MTINRFRASLAWGLDRGELPPWMLAVVLVMLAILWVTGCEPSSLPNVAYDYNS
jgi:hypothetical protein